jgi:hypothetical protein
MKDIDGIVICHFDESGNESYHVFGDERVRLFIVDDRAPHDRVYEVTSRAPTEEFRNLIAEGETIGHSGDARHEAIKARIDAWQSGQPHLLAVE